MNSTWLIISELANQGARKVLYTCVVYTKKKIIEIKVSIILCSLMGPNEFVLKKFYCKYFYTLLLNIITKNVYYNFIAKGPLCVT